MRLAATLKLAPTAIASADNRGTDRTRLQRDATVSADQHDIGLTLHDVSCTGFLAECEQSLEIGQTVRVRLGDIERDAEIVRQFATFVGGHFAPPLSAEELRRVISDSPVVWGGFGGGMPARQKQAVAGTSVYEAPLPGDPNEIAVERWPASVRMSFLLGASALFWALLIVAGS